MKTKTLLRHLILSLAGLVMTLGVTYAFAKAQGGTLASLQRAKEII